VSRNGLLQLLTAINRRAARPARGEKGWFRTLNSLNFPTILVVRRMGLEQDLAVVVALLGARFVVSQLSGREPRQFSMAGLILTVMRLSRTWKGQYWRG
jgi:hypothetical protein